MRKYFSAVLIILFSLSLMAKEMYKDHNINYGVIKGQTSVGDSDYNFWGFGFQYQYRPLNYLNIFTGYDLAGGNMYVKASTKTYRLTHREFTIDLGYRFSIEPMLTLTPFIGRTVYSISSKNSNSFFNSEVTNEYGATNIGFLLEAYPNNKLTVGIRPAIQLSNIIERKYSVDEIIMDEEEFKNTMFFKLDVPVTYHISESLGIIGTISYNMRKLEDKDDYKTKFNNFQGKIGLSHSFYRFL